MLAAMGPVLIAGNDVSQLGGISRDAQHAGFAPSLPFRGGR
jgi:hypothetical protein